jgi:tRNA(fMet)-specific endonuclease VapC
MNAIGSVLVDISIVVDYFRRDMSLHQKIDQVEDLYMPLVVLGELFYGVQKSPWKDKALAQVQEFSRGCIVLLPDEMTAEFYGRIKAELAVAGKTILDCCCSPTAGFSPSDAR